VIHYSYRAVAFPLMQPSMSPLHILVWLLAFCFQILNATSLASWLAAYGPTTAAEWNTSPLSLPQFAAGITIFYLGLAGNFFHDEELREIRRTEQRRQDRIRKEQQRAGTNDGGRGKAIEKHYQIPSAGLFKYMLYPHYLLEWIEWTGFWMACGWGCVPARAFVLNEIFTMLPRAVRGKWWYVERFGEEKIGKKWAILPGVY
jgi:3-oxo-5-alpha-steroid 4-dehydrogenase 1